MLGIVTIVLSIVFLIISITSPVRSSSIIGLNLWANIILTFMLILGILQTVRMVRQLKSKSVDNNTKLEQTDKNDDNNLCGRNNWYILIALGLYALLLPYLGFAVVTIILVIFLAWILEMLKKSQAIITAVLSNAAFILIFAHLLNVPLPKGIGIFRVLSSLLY